MGKAATAITVLFLATTTGCTVGIPLDANMRIAIDEPQAHKYTQNGMQLNSTDMREKLGRELEAGRYIKTANSLQTVSSIFVATGSSVAAWPIGYLLFTDDEPQWLGVGLSLGGLAMALILIGVDDLYVEKAARAHNVAVDEWNREKAERMRRIAAKKTIESLPPLAEGFGFNFDAGPAEAETICKSQGYEWSSTENIFSCSGIPMTDVPQGLFELAFAEGHVMTLRISVRPRDGAGEWATAISKMEQIVTRMYGQPSKKNFTIPSGCTGDAFMGCVQDGRFKGRVTWTQMPNRFVTMNLVNTPPHPRIVVKVKRVVDKDEEP